MDAELELLLAFLQTRWEPDPLATAGGLAAWLAARGLAAGNAQVSEESLARAIHLRAALRSLVLERSGFAPDPRTRQALDAVAKAAPLELVADAAGVLRLAPGGSGVDRALATLVAAAFLTEERGNFDRLKLCKGCGWAFFDESKNRSRIWCDMTTCGSQHKAKAYRLRRAAERGA